MSLTKEFNLAFVQKERPRLRRLDPFRAPHGRIGDAPAQRVGDDKWRRRGQRPPGQQQYRQQRPCN